MEAHQGNTAIAVVARWQKIRRMAVFRKIRLAWKFRKTRKRQNRALKAAKKYHAEEVVKQKAEVARIKEVKNMIPVRKVRKNITQSKTTQDVAKGAVAGLTGAALVMFTARTILGDKIPWDDNTDATVVALAQTFIVPYLSRLFATWRRNRS